MNRNLVDYRKVSWHEYNGRKYRGKKELHYAQNLDLVKKAGEIRKWTPQWPVDIFVNGEKICRHYIDFRVVKNDGSVELVEVKGWKTSTWKLKRKLLEATFLKENPKVKYYVTS